MILNSIFLKDFRCYTQQTYDFSPAINVITGENGTGKTSLLEAIGFMSAARSFRTIRERELIRFGQQSAFLSAKVADSEASTHETTVEIVFFTNKRREIYINSGKLESPRELLGALPSILFSPEDLNLLRGVPGERRRFLDISLCQLKPAYMSALSKYRKLLDGKNILLRQISEKPSFKQALPDFNGRLAETGAYLSTERAAFVATLNKHAEKHHSEISGGKEHISFVFQSHAMEADKTLLALEAKQEAELAQRQCLVGAHRDDIDALYSSEGAAQKSLKSYGSQGQTRTAGIALKMAQRDVFSSVLGYSPLLLLDDVLSELDRPRQDYILHNISGGQVFITCCDPERLTQMGKNIVVSIVSAD